MLKSNVLKSGLGAIVLVFSLSLLAASPAFSGEDAGAGDGGASEYDCGLAQGLVIAAQNAESVPGIELSADLHGWVAIDGINLAKAVNLLQALRWSASVAKTQMGRELFPAPVALLEGVNQDRRGDLHYFVDLAQKQISALIQVRAQLTSARDRICSQTARKY